MSLIEITDIKTVYLTPNNWVDLIQIYRSYDVLNIVYPELFAFGFGEPIEIDSKEINFYAFNQFYLKSKLFQKCLQLKKIVIKIQSPIVIPDNFESLIFFGTSVFPDSPNLNCIVMEANNIVLSDSFSNCPNLTLLVLNNCSNINGLEQLLIENSQSSIDLDTIGLNYSSENSTLVFVNRNLDLNTLQDKTITAKEIIFKAAQEGTLNKISNWNVSRITFGNCINKVTANAINNLANLNYIAFNSSNIEFQKDSIINCPNVAC